MLAWMIKNGKITTDVGTNNNDMFRAPYVFANGVKTAALPKPKTSQKTKQGNKPKTKIAYKCSDNICNKVVYIRCSIQGK